ncbi:MAG: topoisomerase DNA-binding C4 zinc finger domain-containing protein [Candidatus Dormibacteraceae bacterium]
MPHFRDQASAVSSPVGPAAPTGAPFDSTPACPKCGSKMILRTAKSGANAGGQFWGCSNFPRCRSVLPLRQEPQASTAHIPQPR